MNLSIFLFESAGYELDTEDVFDGNHLRELGIDLKNRLEEAATITDKFVNNGWTAGIGLTDLYYINDYVNLEEGDELDEYLKGIGVDPEEVCVEDYEVDMWDEDDGE